MSDYVRKYLSVTWSLVRLLLVLVPNILKPFLNHCLCFLPISLCRLVGNRPRRQPDSAIQSGYRRKARWWIFHQSLRLTMEKASSCWQWGDLRERERESTPHLINHILICNFILTSTKTQSGVCAQINGYVRKCKWATLQSATWQIIKQTKPENWYLGTFSLHSH